MENPALASGSRVGQWIYEALQNEATAAGQVAGPPWEILSDPERERWQRAGTATLELMRQAGLLNVAKAQIDPALARVLPRQRAN